MRRRVAALLALSLLAGCSGSAGPQRPARSPTTVPRAGSFARPASMMGEPCGLEVSEEDLWVLACSGTLLRIPKVAGAVRAKHLGGEVLSLDGLVRGSEATLWALVSARAARTRRGMLVPIDLRSGDLGRPVSVGASVPMSTAEAGGRLWAGMLDGRLLEISAGSVRAIATGGPLRWVLADRSGFWTIAEDGTVAFRDPATGAVLTTFAGIVPDPISAAAAFGSLWGSASSGVKRLDRVTGVVREIGVDGTVNGIEPCGGTVWLSQPDFGLRSLDPDGVVAASVALDVASRYLACDGRLLWVLTEDGRIGSVRIAP